MPTCQKCDKPSKSLGLCSTHYNQTRPNRHPRVTKACDACGTQCSKEARSQRYKGTYCSELCRDYATWGPTSCTFPKPKRRVATPKPPSAARSVECGWCGNAFQTTRTRARFCTPRCLDRFKKAARRGREHNAYGTYSWAELAKLWKTFEKCCAYCRRPTPLDKIQAEHVVALSRGGANNLTNLLPSCSACNSDKRDLALSDWALDRERRHLAPVITSWSHADPLYRHLTSTLTYLEPLAA